MPENCDKDYGCEGCSFKGNCEAEREANKGKGIGVIDPNPYSKITGCSFQAYEKLAYGSACLFFCVKWFTISKIAYPRFDLPDPLGP